MKIKIISFFVASVLFLNCNDKKIKTIEEKSQKVEQNKITPKTIENFSFKDYALSSEGQQLIENWSKYKELEIQIDYLRKADLSFFNGDLKLLKDFIIAFKKEIPERLKTNSIISRTVAIETMLLKLHDDLTLNNIDSKVKLQSIKAVLVTFANLNYQINKKLEMDHYNKIQPE